jgi:UMF1 family MFS transporter
MKPIDKIFNDHGAEQPIREDLSVTGEKPAGLLGLCSWISFDWAVIACFGLINIFIFAPYFTNHVVGDPVKGQAIWGYTQASAGFLIALASPLLGSMADASGARKPWIKIFWLIGAIAMMLLWFAEAGAPYGMLPIIINLIVISICIEYMVVFHNAMLPSLVRERNLGTWSGISFGVGYIGSVAALFFVLSAFSLPEETLFGLNKAAHEQDRIIGPLSAVWMTLFILPLFLFAPDRKSTGLGKREAVRQGIRSL